MSKSARQTEIETEDAQTEEELHMTAAEMEAAHPVPVPTAITVTSDGEIVPASVGCTLKGATLAKLSEMFGTGTLGGYGDAMDLSDLDYEQALAEAGTYEDDYPLVDEADLIGVPFVIVGVQLNDTDLNVTGVYVNVRCRYLGGEQAGEKFSFNDGSTGVYAQLLRMAGAMPEPRPIKVAGGLRVSTYHYSPLHGVTKEGTPNAATFYLNSSTSAKLIEKSKLAIAALGK
jgi:hypothetical protein